MTEMSDALKVPAVVWKTEKANCDRFTKVSSDFPLLGKMWHLEMKHICGGFEPHYHSVNLVQNEGIRPEAYFSVLTYVHITNATGFFGGLRRSEVYNQVVSYCRTIIWECDEKTFEEKFCGSQLYLRGCFGLTVVCVFMDLPRSISEFRSLNETIEITTQTDFDCSPAAKKFKSGTLSLGESDQTASRLHSNLDSLSRDLAKLLEDTVFPDVNLRCGDQTVAAHKAVLAARSEVFSSMFQTEMLESATGVVDITDVDVEILECFLKYVYTGRLSDLSDDDLPQLYAAADKYAVSELKRACSERLINNLTPKNCLHFLLLANAPNYQDLKNAILDFILNNMEILRSQEWIDFTKENPTLSVEVFQMTVEKNFL